ncbi:MAG TPA: pyrimidine 5'-nucleotidase [Anaerolineae bacterium]|mgnify:FL=1|nr:pyrimidine 5'-nucleotidase [Anaerolineae bacterium]HQI87175.1 pyrimidine 5'-nucleotidase [Anaerolineae bacterium]
MPYIIFDLDDTLYTNETGLFKELGTRLVYWVSQQLGISLEESAALRREYFQAHGTMMRGLLLHHPEVNIDAYLDYVHDIDVSRYIAPNPALDAMLARLDAPKAVFTNSVADWAERILRQLGIRGHFTHIIDVRAVDYQSKPHPHAFERALAILGTPASACIMLDDQVSYLRGAAAAGMRTVLVHPGAEAVDGIDYVVGSILEAEPVLQHWLTEG